MNAFTSCLTAPGRLSLVAAATAVSLSLCTASARGAAFATFDETTDTISVTGQTIIGNTATYEATLQFTDALQGGGMVFNEWTNFLEDKQFNIGPTYVFGYAHPVSPDANTVAATIALNAWHHVAYVLDTNQERFYLDGTLIGSKSLGGGDVGDSDGLPFVGAVPRDSVVASSFRGLIDSLRISDTARYSGNSFVPTIGDLPTDANTLLLFNFDEPPGSTTIADASGNGHTGTLGTGFREATSPTLAPEPGGAAILAGAAAALLRRRQRNRRCCR